MQRRYALDLRGAARRKSGRFGYPHPRFAQRDDAAVQGLVGFAPGVTPFPLRDLDALPLSLAPNFVIFARGL